MNNSYKFRTAFITGATSGIGKACAERLARENYRLILCGRREDRLAELEKQLGVYTAIHSLSFDVRDAEAVANSIASLPSEFQKIDILINNAGNAHGLDPIQAGSIEDWDAMLDINVKGLLYVSKQIIPQFIERKEGHIINIESSELNKIDKLTLKDFEGKVWILNGNNKSYSHFSSHHLKEHHSVL